MGVSRNPFYSGWLFHFLVFLYVPVRSVYVPYAFPIPNNRRFMIPIRSHAFRATLPLLCEATVRSDTFRVRSVCVPQWFRTILLNFYTFPCVPDKPPAHLHVGIRSYTFRVRSCCVPAGFRGTSASERYVPIRSSEQGSMDLSGEPIK